LKQHELRIADYPGHILQAIERINTYTDKMDEIDFIHNQLVQDAVIRNIEIIGEAARNIQKEQPAFAKRHTDVPWEDIYLMRNRVSHGYFSIDMEVVWKTVLRDIPELAKQIRDLQEII
jgi:uncharacterized protein with HEPN domain